MRTLNALSLLALAFSACNSTMQGEQAPHLPTVGWIQPDGSETELDPGGRWLMVQFFSPG